MTRPQRQDANKMTGMTAHARKRNLKPWQVRTVATVIALIALALAAYAAAASYESVSHLAASRDVPLPWLNPIGIDGGLAGVILFSIALIWIRKPIGWLRFVARLFAAGTIAANLAAGWPDPVSMGLRAAAPVLFVVLVEATYTLLVHRDDAGIDRIPRARWILAPVPTFRMWRRMKLWEIRNYPQALDMELSRRQAIMKLGEFYGGTPWQDAAPAHLVMMLTEGVKMDDALAMVAELTIPPEPEVQVPVQAPRSRVTKRRGSGVTRKRGSAVTKGASSPLPAEPPDDMDTQAEALRILSDKPEISGGELGRRLGKSESYGCRLKNKLAASVAGPEAPGAGA
jgi:hypothetical protein